MSKKKTKSSKKGSSKKQPLKLSGKESWIWVAGAIIVVLVAVAMCTSRQPIPESDVVVNEPEEVEELPKAPEEPVVEEAAEEAAEESGATENPEILKLMTRLDQIKSYTLTPARYHQERGETRVDMNGVYQVYGERARVEVSPLLKMPGWSADFVYVDLSEETATAYCEELAACHDEERSEETDFAKFSFVLPESFVDDVVVGEITGQRNFARRTVKVVEWEENGLYWEGYVDAYYGLPLRVIAHSDPERTDAVSGWEFRDIAFNNVKAKDVEAPW